MLQEASNPKQFLAEVMADRRRLGDAVRPGRGRHRDARVRQLPCAQGHLHQVLRDEQRQDHDAVDMVGEVW
eukprot:2475701-Pleurochrysis_carterae.AAC.1